MPNIRGPGYYNLRGTLGLMDRIIDRRFVIRVDEDGTLADKVHRLDVTQGHLSAAALIRHYTVDRDEARRRSRN